jgi:hypothetical protein
MEEAFVGTGRLVSHESRTADGRVRYPFGRDAQSYLTYTAEGFLCVAIMGTHRPHFCTANDYTEGTPEVLLAAGKQYLSYAGTCEVREGGVILHRVEVSLFPNSGGRRPGAALPPGRRSAHALDPAGPQQRPTPHVTPDLPNARADLTHLSRAETSSLPEGRGTDGV